MKIFFIKKEEILKNIDINSIPKLFKSEKRNLEFFTSRLLVKYVASNIYDIENTEIKTENKKPEFIKADLKFNISHSNNLVAAAFSKQQIGLDVEKIKGRNLEQLSKHFNKNFSSEIDFYKFWTRYEAEYKSGIKGEVFSFMFEDYIFSLSCIQKSFKLYMLKNLKNNNESLIPDSSDISFIKNLKFEIEKIDSNLIKPV